MVKKGQKYLTGKYFLMQCPSNLKLQGWNVLILPVSLECSDLEIKEQQMVTYIFQASFLFENNNKTKFFKLLCTILS